MNPNQNNKDSVSVRQIARLLKKMHVSNGDILALKTGTQTANIQDIDRIVNALEKLQVDALIVVVDDFDDLSVLNEIEMNKRGWYKLEKLLKRSS